jgi:PAS domain S-box-containing protein
VHSHVALAAIGGAALNALPIALLLWRPAWSGTRHAVAITQMLWSAMFIHLTGGRIEAHFHVFVSLAYLSFYRDPRLLITATLVVAAHHMALGFLAPASIYGIAKPEWWRFPEHAAWVIFEDIVLYFGCRRQLEEMAILSDRESTLELANEDVQRQVEQRTEELKASGEKYRALIENTSAVPWEMDYITCDIVYIAPQMSAIFNLPPERAVAGANFLNLLHNDDRAPFQRFIRDAGEGRCDGKRSIDSRIVTAQGRTMHVRSFIAVKHQDAHRIVGICLDITQQRALELELIQAQKLESIGQLSAGIAHEINTPTQFIGDNVRFLQESVGEVLSVIDRLTPLAIVEGSDSAAAIAALLESVDMDYLRNEVPKAISQSLDGVDRIIRIVGAMKDFSHPALERTPYDLNRAIASTIIVASNEWKYVADIETRFDPDLPPVPVMPGAFNQVILNMLVNAAHAIGAVIGNDSRKGLITLSTARTANWAEIRISDTGCGIPDGIRDRIFDQFFTTKEVGKGTGQGLAIAHDVIVKKHQGSIAVESTVGAGTTFTLRLPLETSSAAAVAA